MIEVYVKFSDGSEYALPMNEAQAADVCIGINSGKESCDEIRDYFSLKVRGIQLVLAPLEYIEKYELRVYSNEQKTWEQNCDKLKQFMKEKYDEGK